jgi:hypothetical protein
MDATVARSIALLSHDSRLDRFGEPVVDHVERVAAAVPPDARSIAFLHDVLEHSGTTIDDLRAAGLSPLEQAALDLLTRGADESYEAHTLRVAHAPGREGALARTVKLADLDDHLAHREMPHAAPPYAWARMHIATGRARRDGVAPERAAAA